MKNVCHTVDFCVVGGGIAGLCAAIAAARHGLKVALIHDRPVLGGNASSEIRMWICGARGKNNRETGIIEEILLENHYLNPLSNYSVWDSILYGKARYQKGLTLLLNCSCVDIEMQDRRIKSVKGWQLTTETWHTISANIFADCSGDSILATLSGAEFRTGRESREEFNEDIAPVVGDNSTMGMSCLIQARETECPQKFTPPKWAYKFCSDVELNNRGHRIDETNFWWLELGGVNDSIHDSEEIKDDLLKIAFGTWDHIKNYGDHGAENWVLDWIGFLPGKRESRRYVGDHILTQNDIRSEGRFSDIVAYGGWPMDDHNPLGFNHHGDPTIFHPAPSPYGISYRCLYSRNIENMFFAGRNISATHAAMSSTRVMGTCAILGQAVGTAASIAINYSITPKSVYEVYMEELQHKLMEDDSYLPWHTRPIFKMSKTAELTASEGNPEPLRNGFDRPIGCQDNGWTGSLGSWVQYSFKQPENIEQIRIVFDSDLNRKTLGMRCFYSRTTEPFCMPKTLIKSYDIEIETERDGNKWQCVFHEDENYQRLVRIPLSVKTSGIRIVPKTTWGAENAHIFAFDVR